MRARRGAREVLCSIVPKTNLIDDMTENDPASPQSSASHGVEVQRLVRILCVAWEGWWEVFVFVPSFAARNVFFIERDGGPITYLFALVILPISPLVGAACGIAQALINVDEELCKPND